MHLLSTSLAIVDLLSHDREYNVLQPPYPGSRAMFKIKGKWITSGVKENIHRAHAIGKTREYYNNRFEWRRGQFDKVSWDSVRRARNKMKGKRLTDTSKIMTGWLPTNGKRGYVTGEFGCPGCKCSKETMDHMMQCENKITKEARRKGLVEFKKKCLKHGVPYDISNRMSCVMRHHMGREKREVATAGDEMLERATKEHQ